MFFSLVKLIYFRGCAVATASTKLRKSAGGATFRNLPETIMRTPAQVDHSCGFKPISHSRDE